MVLTNRLEKESFLQQWLNRIDVPLLVIILFLSVLGILLISSATATSSLQQSYIIKQTVALVIGFVSLVILTFIPYSILRNYLRGFFVLNLILLILVLVFGKKIHGSRSWIHFGAFDFQPVEIVKILTILTLAGYLEKLEISVISWLGLIVPSLIVFIPVALILMQPDFSSSLVFFAILLGMFYVTGIPVDKLIFLLGYGIVTAIFSIFSYFLYLQKNVVLNNPVLYFFYLTYNQWMYGILLVLIITFLLILIYWFLRKLHISFTLTTVFKVWTVIIGGLLSSFVFRTVIREYQQKRLIVFLAPDIDPLGVGYHLRQSKIAIGSGQLFGRGLFQGTQSRLGFLPTQHSDFIFSVLAEELGFLGSLFILVLYFFLVYRLILIARDARDRFGCLIVSGIAAMLVFYIIVNVGMTLGIMPIVGIPLPFLSYGGSALFGTFIAMGLVMSIRFNRSGL